MEQLGGFTFVDRNFFEPLSRLPTTRTYVDLLVELLPADWRLERWDIWVGARCDRLAMPDQGFKIHVSSLAENAETTLRRVVPELVRTGTLFKIVGDPMLHRFLNSKQCGRGSGGKFLTVYPRDEETFRSLVETIHQLTTDLSGPYILSDRRYGTSKVVHYRYGGFRTIQTLQHDGTTTSVIIAPDGTDMADERLPYFSLPEWVQDPFPEAEEEDEDEPLNGRYQVHEALAFSNTGGVYRATDLQTGDTVVIKESRPGTDAWISREFAIGSTQVLRREWEALQRLQGLDFVPAAVELFEEWEHLFLVIGFVQGMPLARYRAQDDVIVIAYMDQPDRVARFCERFRTITGNLIAALEAVHERGVILGDVSPNNILIDPETLRVGLIDFESACLGTGDEAESYSSVWFTPGFRRASSLKTGTTLAPSDDYYGLGMAMYNLLFPVQSLFDFSPAAAGLFMESFIEAGLPDEVRQIIEALLDGQPETAKQVIASWNPSA